MRGDDPNAEILPTPGLAFEGFEAGKMVVVHAFPSLGLWRRMARIIFVDFAVRRIKMGRRF
jgi:hypothetical protein